LSNVLDHVLLGPNAVHWAGKTVSQVHKEWTSAQHADADTNVNGNVKEPFNKVLLAKCKAFVAQCLVDPGSLVPFHPAFTAKSAFIKSLKAMSSRSKSATAVVTPVQLLLWTVESEAASQQYPWGESVPIGPALGYSLETTLSDSSVGGMTVNGQLYEALKESEEIINAEKKNGRDKNGDSKMTSIKLVVDGAPLTDLLKLSTADYCSYHGSNNGNGDNSDYDVKDELGDSSDSGDESYEEATTGKRLKKLKAVVTKEAPKKRAASSHAVKTRPSKKANVTKVEIPNDAWSPDRTAEALVRKIILQYYSKLFVRQS
jgi:hypothetical protein